MQVERLPHYSTERYYLLSEIEQKVSYIFLDESTDFVDKANFGIVYALWNAKTPLASFQKDIEKTILDSEKFINNFENSLLSIEVLISNTLDWNLFQNIIQQFLAWVNENYNFGMCFIGVADNVAGTPALEKCNEYTEHLFSGNNGKVYHSVIFLAAERQQLLGHDPSREPDAGSGIFQVVCYDTSLRGYSVTDWYSKCKEQFTNSKGQKDNVDVSKASEVKPKQPEEAQDTEMYITLLVGVIAVIIGSIYHVAFHNNKVTLSELWW